MAKIPFPSGLPTGPISQEAPLSGGEIAQIVSPTRAAGELAGSLTRIGGQFFEQVGRATAAREISEVKAFITGQITDMKAHVDENSDYLNYPKEWDKRTKAIGERIAGVKGGGARRALQNLWAGEAVVYQGNVDQWTRDKSFEADDVAAQNRIDGIINNLSLAEAEGVIAQNFAATGIGEGSEFTQEDVQLQLIEQEIAQRADRWGPKKTDAIRDAAIKDLLAAGEVNRMDAIYRELSALGPNEALKALTQIEGLTTAQRNGLEARFTGDKLFNDQKAEEQKIEIDTASVAPQDEFLQNYDNVISQINNSAYLSVKEKEEQRKKINSRVDAIKGGKIDPINQWDQGAYDNISIKIARSPHAVKFSDIQGMVGRGTRGGITLTQSEVLTDLLKKHKGADVIGNDLHRTYLSALRSMKTAKAFSSNKVENATRAADAMALLNAWAVKQVEPNADDYQDFFDKLTDNSNLSWWTRFWAGSDPAENRVAVERNLAEMQKEVRGEKTYKAGDKRTVDGAVWTFDGKVWRD